MKVGSLFAGIGGFDLGFERAGFTVAWCVEWDKNAQAVLRKRFQNAKVYGDIREVDPDSLEPVDIVCGGFPCQDLSVAGKRAGLAGERSGLFHDAMRIVRRLNPRLIVLENVPGLLSSNRGLDFATVLREVGQGWDCAEVGWRVLDSQYFGVAQRRRRVFIVGSARAGCAEEILALAESCGGNPPSRGEAREAVAANAARCFAGSREASVAAALETTCHDYSKADGFNMVAHPFSPHGHYRYEASDHAATLQDRENRQGGHTHLVAHAFYSTGGTHGLEPHPNVCPPLKVGSALGIPSPPAVAFTIDIQGCKGNANVGDGSVSPTLGRPSGTDCHAVAIPIQDGRDIEKKQNGFGIGDPNDPAYTLDTTGAQAIAIQGNLIGRDRGGPCGVGASAAGTMYTLTRQDVHGMAVGAVVRRLTPLECERLQGFPDGWTDIGTPEKPTADSHRYKQLGNAVTVNVAGWIARRAKTALQSNQ